MTDKTIELLDSHIFYRDVGDGPPIVLLHGNPTSSHLWRDVIPGLASDARCLAPDLIGMGRSGRPSIEYRFFDHVAYLDAWFDSLGLDDVTLVLHDWGSALGFHWAARHPERVRGLAFFEAILKPRTWAELTNEAKRKVFQDYRTPGLGKRLIMEENFFVEVWLPRGVVRDLSPEELDAYREPFPTVESRLPVWRFPQEIPFDGDPPDVDRAVAGYSRYLQSSTVPKLLLTFTPGSIMDPPMIQWARDNIRSLDVVECGAGVHFVQEDQPDRISAEILDWWRRKIEAPA